MPNLKSLYRASSIKMDSAQESDVVIIIGDLNRSEKLSDIKPPLGEIMKNRTDLMNKMQTTQGQPRWFFIDA